MKIKINKFICIQYPYHTPEYCKGFTYIIFETISTLNTVLLLSISQLYFLSLKIFNKCLSKFICMFSTLLNIPIGMTLWWSFISDFSLLIEVFGKVPTKALFPIYRIFISVYSLWKFTRDFSSSAVIFWAMSKMFFIYIWVFIFNYYIPHF